jgi:hypothetical protein
MQSKPFDNKKILRIRLLHTAMIRTILHAWNYGCSIANPRIDVRILALNHKYIVDAVLLYFCGASNLQKTEDHGCVNLEYLLPTEAEQLIPQLREMERIHRSMKSSGSDSAEALVGQDMFETVQNLIDFFERGD